jgi:outer membrane protein insertion porin family
MPASPIASQWGPGNAALPGQPVQTAARPESPSVARGQTPPGPALPDLGLTAPGSSDEPRGEPVVDVKIGGAPQTPEAEILRQIHTRPGRPYDPDEIDQDVRRLYETGKFVKVTPRHLAVPGGQLVIFEVLERPTLRYVKYVGNEKISKKKLEKESAVKAGDALDPFAVEQARARLEEFYRGKGYNNVRITILEGTKTSDLGAIFLINEGTKQRVGWTLFIGNTIASDAKLRTKIQSKPGPFWIFKGQLDRRQIEQDVDRLKAYYTGLGFIRAEISRLPVDPAKTWQMLTFVINEGPRYAVRKVSFVGNEKFSTEELGEELKLEPGDFFNQAELRSDLATIRDRYGAVGHIFAKVEPDVRLQEEPGELDLVYEIQEGKCCRVGRIYPEILGDNPRTQIATVLNRLSLSPGDVVDIRELRASERRLKASGLFEYDPSKGIAPQIVVRPPDLEEMETGIARQPPRRPQVRGQSPKPVLQTAYRAPYASTSPSQPEVVDLCLQGWWIGNRQAQRPQAASRACGGRLPSASAEPLLVRGQYSADAGLTIPPLRRPEPWTETQPAPRYGESAAPAQTAPASPYPPPPTNSAPASPPPGGSSGALPGYPPAGRSTDAGPGSPPGVGGTYSGPTYPRAGGSGRYDPPPSGPPAGTLAPSSPTYGNQFPGGSVTVPPVLGPPPGVVSAAPPDAVPESLFLGLPPSEDPPLFVPLNPEVYEARTGRLMFSVGVNSEAGLLGSVIVDEQNFNLFRPPRSWEDIRNGTAWRGRGQRFRLEAVPGTEVQRYTVNFQEPYLFDSQISLGLSGYYYTRWYREWDEERLGGRVSLGYQFTHDLSGTLSFRGAKINIFDPIVAGLPELDEALGDNALYGFRAQLAHDTRDNAFLATEGHYLEIGVEQVVGSFEYTRGDIDLRRYFLLRQHPDGSGRHVLSLNARAAVTSEDTPIYEHYFAGGFSTLRGFDFRGASPRDPGTGVLVGGHFMLLASVEYMFPITADDNLRMVVFCDTGTVQPTIDDWRDNYRVAPGLGLRIAIPAMGPAPIALDFAFPVSEEPGDENEVFSFFIGFLR